MPPHGHLACEEDLSVKHWQVPEGGQSSREGVDCPLPNHTLQLRNAAPRRQQPPEVTMFRWVIQDCSQVVNALWRDVLVVVQKLPNIPEKYEELVVHLPPGPQSRVGVGHPCMSCLIFPSKLGLTACTEKADPLLAKIIKSRSVEALPYIIDRI